MSRHLSIIGGRVIDPASGLDNITDVHIAAGHIVALGDAPDGFHAEWTLDAHQHIVCPGLVDLAVRLREPGAEHKGTILSETRAAANNGITTLCCPPDTNPVIDTPAVAELLQQRVMQSGMSTVLPIAALTQGLQGQHLAEMGDLRDAGCVAVSNAMSPLANTEVLRQALTYAANCQMTVLHYPQDAWLGRYGYVHESAISTRLGLSGIPIEAETIEIARCLELVELTGARVHFGRLSAGKSVELIAQAQQRGLPITADVAAHQLFLTEMDVTDYNALYRVLPPLRSERDRVLLRQGLAEGVITAICSDHQPHERDAKLMPFAETEPGMSTLDTLLPLVLRFAQEMQLDLSTALGFITHRPTEIVKPPAGTGRIGVDTPANLCLFAPDVEWELSENNMHSAGKNSPLLGWRLQGQVVTTLINGKVVYTR